MIGMKSVLVSRETLEEAKEILADAGIDSLAREGGMIHITAADPSMSCLLYTSLCMDFSITLRILINLYIV